MLEPGKVFHLGAGGGADGSGGGSSSEGRADEGLGKSDPCLNRFFKHNF